ncbi:copper resistance protein CopC [Nocardioides cheoyonin]|uniref:copper resistance protein CopC n=1 Tax=Nocardioides cheoyonin TaxID=3156615 RepID=UPI0032B589AC
MKCSEVREALSSWYDGERSAAPPPAVTAHVAGCAECADFEKALGRVDALVERARAATGPAPDLAARVVRRPRAAPTDRLLQWAVGLSGLGELATTAYDLLGGSEHHGHEAHASNEAVALTVGLCVALLCAAVRPRLARPYLPVLGVASVLMVAASVHDVHGGEVSLHHELQHTGLVVGFLLLCLMGARRPGGPSLQGLFRRRPPRPGRPPLQVVGRALAPAALAWRLRWVRVGTGTLLSAALVLVSGPAEAHAVLEQSSPGPSAVLRKAPATVVLRFDEPVTLLPTSLQVIAPDGTRVGDGAVGHHADDPATASVGLSGATAQGTYLVSWRVVSADSHPVSGAFTFSVGRAGPAPAAASTGSDRGVGVALGVGRWIGYAGSALLVGGLMFLVACRPGAVPRRALLLGAAAVAVGGLVCLLLKGPYDAGLGATHLTDGSLLREVLGTTYGGATLARIVLAVLGAALVVGWTRLTARTRAVATAVLAVALAVCLALAGHAAAASPRWLAVAADAVHVAAMSAWLGGLVMLLLVVLRRPRRPGPGAAGPLADPGSMAVARRFSRLALGAVAALVVTGGYQAWRETRSWGALRHTTYGQELIVKLIAVLFLLAVAAGSRELVWRHADLAGLRRTVGLEAAGVAAVLGVTSALVATAPAQAAYHPSVDSNLTILGDTVQVSGVPDGDRSMELHVYVFGRTQRPTEPKEVTATVSKGDLGPLRVNLAKAGTGHRQGVVSVPVAGDWTLTVTLRTTAVDQDSGTVTLPIR